MTTAVPSEGADDGFRRLRPALKVVGRGTAAVVYDVAAVTGQSMRAVRSAALRPISTLASAER